VNTAIMEAITVKWATFSASWPRSSVARSIVYRAIERPRTAARRRTHNIVLQPALVIRRTTAQASHWRGS